MYNFILFYFTFFQIKYLLFYFLIFDSSLFFFLSFMHFFSFSILHSSSIIFYFLFSIFYFLFYFFCYFIFIFSFLAFHFSFSIFHFPAVLADGGAYPRYHPLLQEQNIKYADFSDLKSRTLLDSLTFYSISSGTFVIMNCNDNYYYLNYSNDII